MEEKNYSGVPHVLELRNINQTYINKKGEEHIIFKDFNLQLEDSKDKGQFIVLMGESGCGKSTILRYITGLQKPTSGEVLLMNEHIKPTDTIPMVFQTPSSLEWYSVLKNVALPLILKGIKEKEAEEKAMEMIKIVGLEGHETKYAKSPLLSGGQLQRVAIARSLVANPNMLLMDEPFSALDSNNRKKMQDFLAQIFKNSETNNLNPTIILVTHDSREAAYLADDIYIMGSNPGHIKNHIKVDFQTRNESMRKESKFTDLVNFIDDAIDK